MFCAIATTIDRCKTECVVDVFQVVKAQRLQKPGLVLTVVNSYPSNTVQFTTLIFLMCILFAGTVPVCICSCGHVSGVI